MGVLWLVCSFEGPVIHLSNKYTQILIIYYKSHTLAQLFYQSGFLNLNYPHLPFPSMNFFFSYFCNLDFSLTTWLTGWLAVDIFLSLFSLAPSSSLSFLFLFPPYFVLSICQLCLSLLLPHYWPFRSLLHHQLFQIIRLPASHT